MVHKCTLLKTSFPCVWVSISICRLQYGCFISFDVIFQLVQLLVVCFQAKIISEDTHIHCGIKPPMGSGANGLTIMRQALLYLNRSSYCFTIVPVCSACDIMLYLLQPPLMADHNHPLMLKTWSVLIALASYACYTRCDFMHHMRDNYQYIAED